MNGDTEGLPREESGTEGEPTERVAAEPPWPAQGEPLFAPSEAPSSEPMLFQSWTAPPPAPPPVRIPNIGHLLLLVVLLLMGLVVSTALFFVGVHFHLFGAKTLEQAGTEIHYILGSEGLIYLTTLGLSLAIFPLFWHESLFAGLQWNGGAALRLRWRLLGAAFACLALAMLSEKFMTNPADTPIEKVFRTPGSGWLLFGFGVTFAPFFEEMFFRGFLLPALCTAYDWIAGKMTGEAARPLGERGHPQWSLAGMIVGSIATSLPFAAMHGQQTGYAFGPFLLLVGVSLVLCGVRLGTRSLAASTMVHACYNFILFVMLAIGTSGFTHLDKM